MAPPVEQRGATAVRLRKAAYAGLYLLLLGFALSPLLWASVPPLVDYPNHLARMSILAQVGNAAAWTQSYEPHWRLVPNLAMDLIVPPLARLVGIELAGRLFVGSAMALLVLGTAAIHRALFGRVTLWPLCSLLFLYNAVLAWGFVNYLFGLGVALTMFAAWLRARDWRPARRLPVFAVAASLLFLLHLFAFGVYGLLVSCHAVGRLLESDIRRPGFSKIRAVLAPTFGQFVPAVGLWLLGLRTAGAGYTSYGSLARRVYSLLAPIAFDVPLTGLDWLTALGAILFAVIAWRSRALRVSTEMRLALYVLPVACLFVPAWLSGSNYADFRLPVAFVFVLIASTRLETKPTFWMAFACVAASALLTARIWSVSEAWRAMDGRFAEFRAAERNLPEGARLLVVQSPVPDAERKFPDVSGWFTTPNPNLYVHMPALAVIDRGVFFPYLFSDWAPVRPRPRNDPGFRVVGRPLTPEELNDSDSTRPATAIFQPDALNEWPCCANWPSQFDFVLWIDFGQAVRQLPRGLDPWAAGSFFYIYRVAHAGG